MSSKELILSAIKSNRPAEAGLPTIPDFPTDKSQWITNFQKAVKANSGNSVVVKDRHEIPKVVSENFSSASKICSLVDEVPGNVDCKRISDPHDLEDLDLVIIKGELGVAENAAVWFSEGSVVHRVLPFITQHLVIVLEKKDLVGNMHEAYKKIKIAETGYGVFIAGPSKTADIEQILVVGAHGSRSLLVVLVE